MHRYEQAEKEDVCNEIAMDIGTSEKNNLMMPNSYVQASILFKRCTWKEGYYFKSLVQARRDNESPPPLNTSSQESHFCGQNKIYSGDSYASH